MTVAGRRQGPEQQNAHNIAEMLTKVATRRHQQALHPLRIRHTPSYSPPTVSITFYVHIEAPDDARTPVLSCLRKPSLRSGFFGKTTG